MPTYYYSPLPQSPIQSQQMALLESKLDFGGTLERELKEERDREKPRRQHQITFQTVAKKTL